MAASLGLSALVLASGILASSYQLTNREYRVLAASTVPAASPLAVSCQLSSRILACWVTDVAAGTKAELRATQTPRRKLEAGSLKARAWHRSETRLLLRTLNSAVQRGFYSGL